MTQRTTILGALPLHVGNEAYTVEALLGGGRYLYHNGPKDFPFFTLAEAERLVARVERAGTIDPTHWTDGQDGYYGTADHEAYLLECERFEG